MVVYEWLVKSLGKTGRRRQWVEARRRLKMGECCELHYSCQKRPNTVDRTVL